jgi:hypothetical protein
VEPKGRLIVKNGSESAVITKVQTYQSAVWLERWTGNAGPNEEITLKLDPGSYNVQITVNDSNETEYTLTSVTVPEGEKRLIFDGKALTSAGEG